MKKGDVFYLRKSSSKQHKCHVCGIVDDFHVVYKWYDEQRWFYEVEMEVFLDMAIEHSKEDK